MNQPRQGQLSATPPAVPGDIVLRGYMVMYHHGEVNHCPGCGRSHWLVGRVMAECAFCGTALPLQGLPSAAMHKDLSTTTSTLGGMFASWNKVAAAIPPA